jgi:shikimate kinase
MSSEKKVVISTNEELKEELGADEYQVYEVQDNEEYEEEERMTVEDLDDAEVIWEGGPTAGDIKHWKSVHGDVYVTSITFDKHIVWRTLTRNEYKQLVKKMEQLVQAGQLTTAEANMWNEEAITEICLLYPAYDKISLSNEMAGLPSLLSQEILEASGFVALEVRQL